MILTIIIAFAVFFLGLLIGFLTAGLMAEARRCDDAEEEWGAPHGKQVFIIKLGKRIIT